MQNSELFRQGIVLPLDQRAEEGLRSNDVWLAIEARHLPIATDALFDKLWNAGLFREINKRCGALIDEYEEEFVEASDLPKLLAAMEAFVEQQAYMDGDMRSFFSDLRRLTDTALRLGRPILFVL